VHTSLISVFLLLKISDLCGWVGFVRKRWTLSGYNLAVVEPGPASLGRFVVCVCDWMSSYPISSSSLSRFGPIPG
jgi:hypothetical protein